MQFRIKRLKINIRPSFLLIVLALSYWQLGQKISLSTLPHFLLLAAIFLVSIACHELGHALAFQKIGLEAEITLHLLGGTTRPLAWRKLKPGQEFFVSLMGPLAGLLLSSLAALAMLLFADLPPIRALFRYAMFINLIWSTINLLPLMPLDGGHALYAIFSLIWDNKGRKILYLFSAITTALAATWAILTSWYWAAVILGYLAVINGASFIKIVKYEAQVTFVTSEAEIKNLLANGAIGTALQKSRELCQITNGAEQEKAHELYEYCCAIAQQKDDTPPTVSAE